MLVAFTGTMAPRLRISGRENVPRRGAAILSPNHISDADPAFVFHSTPRSLWYMAKSELFAMGILGPLIRFVQTFPVDQRSLDRAALRYTEQLLKRGHAVVIFPEGHISKTGELQPLFPGAVAIALRAQVPVVPVGLSGTTLIIPHGSLWPRPTLAPVRVHFGRAIRFDDILQLPKREQRAAATSRLEEAIRAARAVARGAR
ncbi:MAG TPA: lysophospholipid acyltransferase family protein [Abditibacteriaceae bacterium]|nr:lysophospholipid acyltransferase family protein [Abditibacteriaceae bacterium]